MKGKMLMFSKTSVISFAIILFIFEVLIKSKILKNTQFLETS